MFKRMIQPMFYKRNTAARMSQGERRRGGRRTGEALRQAAAATVDWLEERRLFSTINVTTFADVVNSADGVTSVREALSLAAGNSGDDQVVLPAGTYPLNGQLSIVDTSGKVAIQSSGGTATLDAQHRVRVLLVSGGSDVTLEGLRVTGGRNDYGGGIYNSGQLLVTNCAIDGNSAAYGGGGIYNYRSTAQLTNSTLSGNSAQHYGGGIFNDFSSTAQLTNSTVTGNSAQYEGGGIWNYYSSAQLTNSTLSGNSAQYGVGGGICNYSSTAEMTNSTLFANSAQHGGGVYNYASSAQLTSSMLSGNSAQYGGGIFSERYSSVELTNSTVSGNSAQISGGGILNDYPSSAKLADSTISGNSAQTSGGGIYNNGTASLRNTIVAGNLLADPFSGDAYGSFGSQGHNLIGIVDGSIGWQGTDLFGTLSQPLDPKLGPLANNGGPTWTMALLPGSPALNAGNNALAVDNGGNPLTTDQRGAGYARIVGGTVDIGAYELANQPPTADAGGPYGVDEGGSVILSALASTDPDAASGDVIALYQWDLSYDGNPSHFNPTVTRSDPLATFSAAGLGGPSARTVALRAIDSRGAASSIATATVTIFNVPPSISLSGPSSVVEGSTYALTLGDVVDPGPDTVAAYLIDWGDGTGTQHVPAANLPSDRTLTHVYPDGPASCTITVKVADEDGTFPAASKSVQVTNVTPRVTNLVVSPSPINEGSQVTLSGRVVDPGSFDTHVAVINWADGSTQTVDVDPATRTFSAVHRFLDDNPTSTPSDTYVLSVYARDNDTRPVYQTGTMGPTGNLGGVGIDPEQFLGVRFQVNSTVTTGHVGGHFITRGFGGDGLFAAIVRLDGPNDFPDTTNLSSADVVGTTVLPTKALWTDSALYSAALSRTLTPGWYALVFGSGLFGTGGIGAAPTNGTDAGSPSYFNLSSGIYRNGGFANVHFFLDDLVESTTPLTVNNVAPAATILAPAGTLFEGGPVHLAAQVIDPGVGDTQAYQWTVTRAGQVYATGSQNFIDFTPDDDGDYAVTLRVTDDDGGVGTDARTLHVVNVAPTVSLTGNASVSEGSEYRLTLGNVVDPGRDAVAAYVIDWGDGTGTHHVPAANLPADRTLGHTYADGPLSATITVNLADEDGTFVGGSKAVQVNNGSPTARADAVSTLEDTAVVIINVTANDTDPAGASDPLNVIAVNQPAHGSAALNSDGSILYTPAGNSNGSDSFTYVVGDGDGGTAVGTVNVTVTPVNDRPTFIGGPNPSVLEDSGLVVVPGWARNISAGPADEVGQALTFVVAAEIPALFSVQPTVSANGMLIYTPARDANGPANVAVWLRDDGGALNGGRDTSGAYLFVIKLAPVNDRPTFTGGRDQTALRTGGTTVYSVDGWATTISAGPVDEAGQTLNFEVTNDTPELFALDGQPSIDPSGRLTYKPARDATGTATVRVRLRDSGGTADGGQDLSSETTFSISLKDAYLQNGVAYVAGTSANDTIALKPGSVIAIVNGLEVGHFFGALRVVLLGGDGNDNIQVTSEAGHTYECSQFDLSGGAGDDTITVAADLTIPSVLRGDDGNDVLTGGAGDDTIDGGTGENVVAPGLGTNTLISDAGTNTYVPGGGTDTAATPPGVSTPRFAPFVGPITAPSAPVQVRTSVTLSAGFVDLDGQDTLNAAWDWGDGSGTATSPGTLIGTASASHQYLAAGVYTVKLTLADSAGNRGVSFYRYIVAYDPSAGFVTGGGWIDSPAGAYAADPALAGRATFGFVSQYKKGATVPTGNTEFQFRAAGLDFRSAGYDWLVVGGAKAQYKGTGTLNGVGGYRFSVTVVDGQEPGGGGVDRFRIRIWKDGGGVIYDNQMGAADDATPTTAVGGGSVVIHTK